MRVSERNLAIERAYLGGATMQAIADQHGLTRQRVQQIVARGVLAGRVPSWLASMRSATSRTVDPEVVRRAQAASAKARTERAWPKETVARLRDLAARNWSGSMIADELGMSRNKVIGKAWRLGIHLKGDPKTIRLRRCAAA